MSRYLEKVSLGEKSRPDPSSKRGGEQIAPRSPPSDCGSELRGAYGPASGEVRRAYTPTLEFVVKSEVQSPSSRTPRDA